MTVKEIIKNTAFSAGREDVVKYLDGNTTSKGEDTLPTVNLLTGLLNLVISELAGTFIPMIKQESVQTSDGKIFYADLSERAVKIIGVYNQNGNDIDFVKTAEFIKVNPGTVIVDYEYIPPNYGIDDTIGYTEKEVTSSVLSFGLSAEYAISLGDFDQAVMWHKRYVDAISELRKIKNVKIKNRSFV